MKKIIALFLVLFFLLKFSVNLHALDILLENKNYWSPESGPYVETGLMVLGGDLKPVKDASGKLSIAVDILLLFKKNDEIVAFDKYRLSQNDKDSIELRKLAIIDKKRFALEEGTYNFQAIVKDVNNPSDSAIIDDFHYLRFEENTPFFSDIELVESFEKGGDPSSPFVKNGLNILPQIINYFPSSQKKISFYTELYHSAKYIEEDQFLISYNIRKQNDKKIARELNGFKKVNVAEVIPFFAEFNIEGLGTGNYILRMEARNKSNELVCRKELKFQRENPNAGLPMEASALDKSFVEGFDLPSIKYQLRSFIPIAGASEAKQINTLIKKGELEALKRFFVQFWVERAPEEPFVAWYAYTEKVKKVNAEFTTNLLYGFETDRGRVYLQYGAPNQMLEAPRQAGSNPYEIWHYYDNVNGQSNVRFIFLNRDLISNNYELIHSTALGEIKNEQWQTLVQSKGFNSPTETQLRNKDFFGNQLNDFFDQ